MKKRILIAEDDKAILEVIRLILQDAGYEIETIENGEYIYKTIELNEPHLILLDIWLSGLDGGKIAKELKHDDKTKKIPIIMISANNETEKIAKEAGADDFLLKPFNIDDLLSIVQKYIGDKK